MSSNGPNELKDCTATDDDVDNRLRLFSLVGNSEVFRDIHETVSPSLQIPISLAGLSQIIDTLNDVLPLVRKELEPVGDSTLVLERWLSQIGSPDSSNEFWADRKISGGRKHHKKRGTDIPLPAEPYAYEAPLFGLITLHPIWCALWFRSGAEDGESAARHDSFRRLQAWYLSAYLRLLSDRRHTKFKSSIDKAGLLLRRLHQPSNAIELDRFIEIHSAKSAYETLVPLSHGTTWLELGYGALARLLEEAFSFRNDAKSSSPRNRGDAQIAIAGVKKKRQTGANLIYPGHRLYRILLERESWFSDQDNAHVTYDSSEPDSDLSTLLTESGLDSDEFAFDNGLQVDLVDIDDRAITSPKDLPPLGSLFGIANARARAEIMEVQYFRTRLNRIVIADLASIMSVLDGMFALANAELGDKRSTVQQNANRLRETVLLAAAMIVTGACVDDVRHMHSYNKAAEVPRNFKLGYSPAKSVWLRQYSDAPRKPLTLEGQASQIESTPRVVLSDVWGVGAQLGDPLGITWFAHQKSTYERVFKERIAHVLEAAGVPKRWHRLESLCDVLPGWFYGMEEGNHLRVSILFDRPERLASTQRFYSVLDRPALNAWYSNVMQMLMHAVTQNGFKSVGRLFSGGASVPMKDSFVGDDRTPTLDTVRDLVTGLRSKLDTFDKGRMRALIDRHNIYTAYTALGLALVTGFRMVRTPVPDLRLIDAVTGFMSLQEKDRVDGSHARIVWMPERLRRQVHYYLEHLRSTWLGLPSELSTKLEVEATKQRDRSRFGQGKFSISLVNTLFFLEQINERLVAHELTGATLKKQFDNVLPGHWVVENANRHFLRSFLANEGCPETMINAHLGHAHYGEGHWSPASGFDPIRYRSTIAPYLNKILDDVGYAELSV
jgi:hypothetical protein